MRLTFEEAAAYLPARTGVTIYGSQAEADAAAAEYHRRYGSAPSPDERARAVGRAMARVAQAETAIPAAQQQVDPLLLPVDLTNRGLAGVEERSIGY